jgi:hypothetical protein
LARSFHKERCPENVEKLIKWRELLNWFCIVWNVEEVEMTPVIFSFFGGAYKRGQNLMGTIEARDVPMYAQKFRCFSENDPSYSEGDFEAPAITKAGFIESEELYEQFKKLRLELKQGLADSQFDLTSDIEEDPDDVTAGEEKF